MGFTDIDKAVLVLTTRLGNANPHRFHPRCGISSPGAWATPG